MSRRETRALIAAIAATAITALIVGADARIPHTIPYGMLVAAMSVAAVLWVHWSFARNAAQIAALRQEVAACSTDVLRELARWRVDERERDATLARLAATEHEHIYDAGYLDCLSGQPRRPRAHL